MLLRRILLTGALLSLAGPLLVAMETCPAMPGMPGLFGCMGCRIVVWDGLFVGCFRDVLWRSSGIPGLPGRDGRDGQRGEKGDPGRFSKTFVMFGLSLSDPV